MVHAALERGWATHRFNMRGCGNTEELTMSGYHAGQNRRPAGGDRERRRKGAWPIFVVG